MLHSDKVKVFGCSQEKYNAVHRRLLLSADRHTLELSKLLKPNILVTIGHSVLGSKGGQLS